MKMGSSTSAPSVSGHDSTSIEPSTSASVTPLDTSDDSVDVNACCAPLTSDCRRETSLPVCERLKKAMGMRSTWSKIWVRMA